VTDRLEVPPEYLEFLAQSDALEGLPTLNYREDRNAVRGQGHVGALVAVLEATMAGGPLDLQRLASWCRMLRPDARIVESGSPPEWLTRMNHALEAPPSHASEAVTVMAEALYALSHSNVYGLESGRMARLLLAYLTVSMARPVIIVRANETADWSVALKSPRALRLFLAKKVREAVADAAGARFEKTSGDSGTARYRSASGEEMLVDWHELTAAENAWCLATETA
jgi:hypothetical protein